VADVAGYTRLMEAYEEDTHRRLMVLRDAVINVSLAANEGRIVKRTGDGFLALFPSAKHAIDCALTIQRATREREANEPPDRRLLFRLGINVGDVMVETEDVYGNDVNIAARLQDLAEPGEILISASIRDALDEKEEFSLIDLGPIPLKNIIRPVHAFRLEFEAPQLQPRVRLSPSTDQPSIAVLPFRALGGRTPRYFGDGFVEDIVGALASLRELMVISLWSTRLYRDSTLDARVVGQQLGVQYILSGTVQRRPARLQVMTELADAESGSVVWTRKYNLQESDLYDVQDQIMGSIVNTIAPQVRQAEIRRVHLKRPESRNAHDYYLQAMELIYRLRPEEFAQAGAMIRRAIALDDTYAAAYALASEWHCLRVGQGLSPDPETDSREAVRLAEASVARDPMNSLALANLGHHRAYLHRELDEAVALFERALAASPSSARAWGLSAPTYAYMGDPESAIARAQRALRLSPLDPNSFWYRATLGIARYTMRDYEGALEAARIALSENSRYTTVLKTIAASLAALGRLEEAQSAAQALLALEPGFRAGGYAQRYPYRDPSLREQLYRHLVSAGLPE
jgi:adenylate cyclase